ncbi:RNA polymerase sporulation sigma factor SigF [Haloimpatiens lingqiaonensis]|uniref:RNA polymerase sporulation sigma factor SigF n=1 Tax=Haloimpatiens lingqiaonensis TaxID=1380675 RepID=UPI0010FECEB1|nr:RNA polymerase sporulation sigma factor SigF [Haloimpatiens lingqiaonensis]
MENNNINKKQDIYEDNGELIKLAKQGDKKALDEVVQNNLPLVSAVTKRFMNRGYDYEDLFQIGSIGLIKAIKNFNPEFNVKFSTYAVPMMMGEIKRFIRDDGIIKVSRNVKLLAQKIHYDKEKLTKKLGREPTIQELSDFSNVDVDEILIAMESSSKPQYLYDVIHQDDGSPVMLIDKIGEKGQEDEDITDKLLLKEVLGELNKRSRQIIMLRYFKDKTQVEVAKMLGISQVQVSRIEKKVLKILKGKLTE